MADAATAPPDEWSDVFRITVTYELQVTPTMRGWLREMKAEGGRVDDLADELSTRLWHDAHVNVVGSDAEFDFDAAEALPDVLDA